MNAALSSILLLNSVQHLVECATSHIQEYERRIRAEKFDNESEIVRYEKYATEVLKEVIDDIAKTLNCKISVHVVTSIDSYNTELLPGTVIVGDIAYTNVGDSYIENCKVDIDKFNSANIQQLV